MPRDAGQSPTVPVSPSKVLWFVPDRPVEGNTIYVRPASDAEPGAESEEPTSTATSDR